MTRNVIVMLLIGFIASCGASDVDYFDKPTTRIIRVHNDTGGLLDEYKRRKRSYKRSESTIVVSGVCASACIMFLDLQNSCAVPGTMLYVHGVSANGGLTRIKPPRVEALFDREYMNEIPVSMRADFWSTWRHTRGILNTVKIPVEQFKDIKICSADLY